MSDLPILLTPASSDGYDADFGQTVIAAKLDGPSTLLGRAYAGAARIVSVTWHLDPVGYNYFRAFWRTAVEKGTLPFLIDLVSDDDQPSRYQAAFIPDTLLFSGRNGHTYTIRSKVELTRKSDINDLGEALEELEYLVNEVLPENLS